MKILAIETSCDDTGISIIETLQNKMGGFNASPVGSPVGLRPKGLRPRVLSNIIFSQIEVHKKYGGVYPMMAKREHQNNLIPTLEKALKKSKLLNFKSQILNPEQIENLKKILEKESDLFDNLIKFLEKYGKPDIDLIAVTNGPGLEPCLWVGVNFAKALSFFWSIQIVPVNHIEAHILVNFLENPKINFPAVSLVVSGGHTQLILVKGIGKYKILGETRDDAAGECFDKAAKILGLGYPGGPEIARQAEQFQPSANFAKLPRPMMNTKDYDFSFSGLKTAILYKVKEFKNSTIDQSMVLSKEFVKNMCFEIQQAIINVLLKKTIKAAKDYKVKTIILGGGVSANEELRKQFTIKVKKENFKIIFPDVKLSTDNALMIAVTGFYHKNKKTSWKNLEVNANLRVSK